MDTIDVAGADHDFNRNLQSLTGEATTSNIDAAQLYSLNANKDLISIQDPVIENDIDNNIDNMRVLSTEESQAAEGRDKLS